MFQLYWVEHASGLGCFVGVARDLLQARNSFGWESEIHEMTEEELRALDGTERVIIAKQKD